MADLKGSTASEEAAPRRKQVLRLHVERATDSKSRSTNQMDVLRLSVFSDLP